MLKIMGGVLVQLGSPTPSATEVLTQCFWGRTQACQILPNTLAGSVSGVARSYTEEGASDGQNVEHWVLKAWLYPPELLNTNNFLTLSEPPAI